jgi:hypothetical protein
MWYKKFICQLFYAKFRGTAKNGKKLLLKLFYAIDLISGTECSIYSTRNSPSKWT